MFWLGVEIHKEKQDYFKSLSFFSPGTLLGIPVLCKDHPTEGYNKN